MFLFKMLLKIRLLQLPRKHLPSGFGVNLLALGFEYTGYYTLLRDPKVKEYYGLAKNYHRSSNDALTLGFGAGCFYMRTYGKVFRMKLQMWS